MISPKSFFFFHKIQWNPMNEVKRNCNVCRLVNNKLRTNWFNWWFERVCERVEESEMLCKLYVHLHVIVIRLAWVEKHENSPLLSRCLRKMFSNIFCFPSWNFFFSSIFRVRQTFPLMRNFFVLSKIITKIWNFFSFFIFFSFSIFSFLNMAKIIKTNFIEIIIK